MTVLIPGFVGTQNAMPQWVLNMAGYAVKNSYPNIPHPNVQSTTDEHKFRWMLRFFMYSYVGTPLRGASGNDVNTPKILSSSGVMLMLFSLGRWPKRF